MSVIACHHNSFPLHTFPVVNCLAMPPVTRSKKATLYPALNPLGNKRKRIPKKVQQKDDKNIQVSLLLHRLAILSLTKISQLQVKLL